MCAIIDIKDMPNNTRTPITRNNLFYSEHDFELEMGIVEGYLEEDTNQTVVVYQVDRNRTSVNDTYMEAASDRVRFLPPVEVPCLYEIQDAKLDSYNQKTNNGVFSIHGPLKVYINLLAFKKYGFDIRRGDYIGVMIEEGRMYYWVVTDDGKVNTANNLVLGARKVGFRVVEAAPVADDEFNGV